MSALMCTCGNDLRVSEMPCKTEFIFISDSEYDRFEGDINTDKLYVQMKSFFQCTECKRLWVFWEGFNKKPTEYIPVFE